MQMVHLRPFGVFFVYLLPHAEDVLLVRKVLRMKSEKCMKF